MKSDENFCHYEMLLLVQEELYHSLHNVGERMIIDLNLECHKAPKIYFDHFALRILIESTIKRSTNANRFSNVQLITKICTCHFIDPRPSTLGHCHKNYKDRGLVPHLKDLTIF
ncbi:uncharacterized protein LAESUDRAFT_714058 [Laetiporus sulphureus 93-53]|uniref:Uncharacterized protein n=1 Tax=Laetiporus sulphureus 93-53 TaxID=1314785 RepID=A0A165EFF9_9APHY|nr:uncharacterized protein LAESUDRAFT_714058 [Laetiporus sulphureus 93-53]KZT06943.1 hypothetical protein LAESUDRAFT_714058 [Laetiporus sulphureus 93-53]